MPKKILLDSKKIHLILSRLVYELIENHKDFKDTVLIGLQPRGVYLFNQILKVFETNHPKIKIKSGILDFTFFRDDFRRREAPISPNQTDIDFLVEGKKVVFIDDVLYTGRSIRAGMDAINSFGRLKQIELLVLIDRRFSRELPIEPNYVGMTVDAIDTEKVVVEWDAKLVHKARVSLIRE